MTTNEQAEKKPLWLLIEEKILGLSANDLEAGKLEQTIANTAKALDDTGHNVSRHGGNMLRLRWALDSRIKAGKAMMEDLNAAVSALTVEDVANSRKATARLLDGLKDTWPILGEFDRRTDILEIVERTRLDLYVVRAKELGGEEGIRYLIADGVAPEVIVDRMGIAQEEYTRVNAAVEAELAEKARVKSLFDEAEGKSDEDKIKKLINENVTDELMIEVCGFDQAAIDAVKKSMEEELKEKQRREEEKATQRKAEAEGPSLDNMSNDQILEYIESIREIMEFTDQENEIRSMSEQSSIPKTIIDAAVAGEDALDELEKKAEG
ncbi:MAG: hypothetical protein V3R93_07125 [Candidatus Hydrothermarchaeaceae archaeon]